MAAKLTGLTHKIANSGRELYHLQFWIQAASPETFGYTLVGSFVVTITGFLVLIKLVSTS
jgi:hypothetical protein